MSGPLFLGNQRLATRMDDVKDILFWHADRLDRAARGRVPLFALRLCAGGGERPGDPAGKLLAGAAIDAKIAREAPTQAALPASEENLIAGAKIYRDQCVECHGLPGTPRSIASKGMFPDPPQFFERKVMGNDPAGQNYWVVANGIRLSGMPGYRGSLTRGTDVAGQPVPVESAGNCRRASKRIWRAGGEVVNDPCGRAP